MFLCDELHKWMMILLLNFPASWCCFICWGRVLINFLFFYFIRQILFIFLRHGVVHHTKIFRNLHLIYWSQKMGMSMLLVLEIHILWQTFFICWIFLSFICVLVKSTFMSRIFHFNSLFFWVSLSISFLSLSWWLNCVFLDIEWPCLVVSLVIRGESLKWHYYSSKVH